MFCVLYYLYMTDKLKYMQPVALNQLGESVIMATISERAAEQERSHKVRLCVVCVCIMLIITPSVHAHTHSLTHTTLASEPVGTEK
jgi:hypothetical protein